MEPRIIKPIIKDILSTLLSGRNDFNLNITDDTDLLLSGTIDSFEYIELIAAIEERTGLSIDLDCLEEKDMATISGLVRQITDQHRS